MKTGYILGISIGHNASACLLKDGEVVFSIEEERLTRIKADGGPLACMLKTLEYTDKVDAIVTAYPSPDKPRLEYSGEQIYLGFARKIGLIDTLDRKYIGGHHPQYFDLSSQHHLCHATLAFKRSGFDEAAVLIVDGAGSEISVQTEHGPRSAFEIESIFKFDHTSCRPLYKKYGTDSLDVKPFRIPNRDGYEMIVDYTNSIGIAYNAFTKYCDFSVLECGKTMGLAAYGKYNPDIPEIFIDDGDWSYVNTSLIPPGYRAQPLLNTNKYTKIYDVPMEDMAWKIQNDSQEQVLKLIIKASEISGLKNVCLSGGYALNCSANYFYLDELNKRGIKLFVEPNSSDAGTANGAALFVHHYGDMSQIENAQYLPR